MGEPGTDGVVCSVDRVYHYLLGHDQATAGESILRSGLRPLSDFPDSLRWQELQRELPGFYSGLYADWAEPAIGRPVDNSGVFLTPIDFRRMPGSLLAGRPRFGVPVHRLDPRWSVLTYELDGVRARLPVSADTLVDIVRQWPAGTVARWFGVDRQRLFWYVPQLVTYQPGGVPVEQADFEPGR